jgi:FkbM family methyltransferase
MNISKLKNAIRYFLNKNFGSITYSRRSFSQEGEDLIVDRLFEGKKNGFYIEVGCHHPFRFSNTFLFYKRGWRGVCIDPLPGTKEKFSQKRKRDIVIEKGISLSKAKIKYFMFNEPALNTFDQALALERNAYKQYKITKTIDIETDSLAGILEMIEIPKVIDFLSVDVEGFDLQVLRSNNWIKYRPKVVVAEVLQCHLTEIGDDEIVKFLCQIGYEPYAKSGNSVIFKEINK